MSVVVRNNRGLVAKKRIQRPRQVPRLLTGLLADLPAPLPTKRETEIKKLIAAHQEKEYLDHDHFDLDKPVASDPTKLF